MSLYKKNIIASYSAQIVSVVCNFICSVLTARMLGAAGQGELALYISFTALVTLLIGLGLPPAIVYFLAGKKIDKGKIIPVMTSVTLMMLLAFTIFFFTARHMNFLAVFLPDFILENNIWAYIMLLHLLLMMFNQYFSSLLQAENKFMLSGLITVTGSVLLLLMYSAKYFDYAGQGVAAVWWIVGSLLMAAGIQYFIYLVSIYRLDKKYLGFQSFSLIEIKPLLWFAGIAYLANVMQFLNYRMDLWFINYFHHSKEMIGVYALSAGLAQLVWHLPAAVHGVLYTTVSSESDSAMKVSKTARTSGYLLLYGVAAGICGYFLSVWLVPLWFGEDFENASRIIGILLLGIVPFCYGMGISAYFAGIGKVRVNLVGSLIGLLLCLLFDVLFIPQYGIEGAAYASVISYTGTSLYFYLVFRARTTGKL